MVPVIIIIRYGENNVLGQIYISININISQFRGWAEGAHGLPCISRLLFIRSEKLQEHDLSYNQIMHHFNLTFFFLE